MSGSSPVVSYRIKKGTDIVVMSRVSNWQKILVQKSSISAIAWSVYKLATSKDQPVTPQTGTCVVDDSWSDSLLTAGWTADARGYNAYCAIPATAFPVSAKYQVEIIGTQQSGKKFCIADITIDAYELFSR